MEKTNPLEISHESLEVKFDGCPRPHLIIVETARSLLKSPTFKKKCPDSAKDINEKQARSMIKCYEEIKDLVVKSFIHEPLRRFTLVTHLGTFATQAIFHAHIWMDTNQYKKLLHAAKHVPDNNNKNLASSSYVEDVDMYSSKMSKKHAGWLKGETAAVNQAKENKQTIVVTCPDGYEVIYHQCLPYIGFRCKEEKIGKKETKEELKKEEKTEAKETKELGIKQQESKEQENAEKESKETKEQESKEKETGDKKTMAEIFYDVTQFANKHKMAEGGDGCHVCLGGQPAIEFNDGKAVDAFLLASVGTFYKMRCNVDNVQAADQWWINFQNNIVNNPVLH